MADEPIVIIAGDVGSDPVEPENPTVINEPVIEAVADAAVEVALIEANRDVAIAEIHADVELAHIEARAEETAIIEEVETWQKSIEVQIAEQGATLSQLQSNLNQLVETLAPPSLPNPPEPESLEATVEPPATETAPVPDEPVRKVKPLRWI